MKLKNKILIASSAMLVLSGVAAGTSTYAWYTATRVNTINMSTTIESRATGVNIDLFTSVTGYNDDGIAHGTGNGNTDGTGDDGRYTITSTKSIQDTSFAGIGDAHKVAINSEGNADGWYSADYSNAQLHKFTLRFMSTGTSTVNLYLGRKTTLTSEMTGSDASQNEALRMSMVNNPITAYTAKEGSTPESYTIDTASKSLLAYYAPNNSSTMKLYKYVDGSQDLATPVAPTDLTSLQVDNSAEDSVSTKIISGSEFHKTEATDPEDYTKAQLNAEGKLTATTYTAAGTNVGYIATLIPTSVSGKTYSNQAIVTFYMWVEGTATTGNPANYTINSLLNFYTIVY